MTKRGLRGSQNRLFKAAAAAAADAADDDAAAKSDCANYILLCAEAAKDF